MRIFMHLEKIKKRAIHKIYQILKIKYLLMVFNNSLIQ